MTEQEFLTNSNIFLEKLAEELENADDRYLLSVEYHDGILEIIDEDDKTYVINQHLATKKIWYSSPFTGADYFAYEDGWFNKERISLKEKLSKELLSNYDVKINE